MTFSTSNFVIVTGISLQFSILLCWYYIVCKYHYQRLSRKKVARSQSWKSGKAISPFLSDWVTYLGGFINSYTFHWTQTYEISCLCSQEFNEKLMEFVSFWLLKWAVIDQLRMRWILTLAKWSLHVNRTRLTVIICQNEFILPIDI